MSRFLEVVRQAIKTLLARDGAANIRLVLTSVAKEENHPFEPNREGH